MIQVPPKVPRTSRPSRRDGPPPRAVPPSPPGATAVQTIAPSLPAFDPQECELLEGTHRMRHDPLDPPHRALMERTIGINGLPLDWALTEDPHMEDTLVAVRVRPDGIGVPAWFAHDRRLREETFHSPLAGRDWQPDTMLVRRLLCHVPYTVVRRDGDEVHYAFDVRTVVEPRELVPLVAMEGRHVVIPASGGYATEGAEIETVFTRVPFSGDRFARSTRKRFKLAVPGHPGDATVEGVAARILAAHGYRIESPRLFAALYRMLIGEVVAHWWRRPSHVERTGALSHHPPGANPLEATLRGMEAVQRVALGEAPEHLRRFGAALVASGRRPETYLRYTERLAHLAEAMGPGALAGCLEGLLRGHRAVHADLLATHAGTRRAFLVEVKSRGDRLRDTQIESALWHARDQRCGYRLMKVDHPEP